MKVLFYFLLCCLTVGLSIGCNQKENVVKCKFAPGGVKVNMRTALKKAFDEGYFNGRNSYIAQTNNKSYEYTSFTKKYSGLTESQIRELEQENQRGYLEGYHKATAEFSCPIE